MKRFRAGVLIAALSVSILAVGCGRSGSDSESGSGESSTAKANANCTKEALQATEIGVSADTISVEVMADTGSPLAPGLFQGNVDAMNAYAKWINANGGVGCRQLKVEAWDSKIDPTEAKNGIINACKNNLAMVGALVYAIVCTSRNCKFAHRVHGFAPDLRRVRTSFLEFLRFDAILLTSFNNFIAAADPAMR